MQRIMVQNIDDVLQRGAVLTELDSKAQNLVHHSSKYKKSAATLNATSLVAIGAGASILLVIFFNFQDIYAVPGSLRPLLLQR